MPVPPTSSDNALLVGLTPRLSQVHGWGIYGYQLTLRLLAGGLMPVLLCEVPPDLEGAAAKRIQATIDQYHQAVRPALDATKASGRLMTAPFPVLHALHNDFQYNRSIEVGPLDVGSIFFEDRRVSDAGLARARRFRRIIAGSRWNAEILEALGLPDVRICHQGVDTGIFFPETRGNLFGTGRFVVFSGGQLHLRKGQDIVVAAFAAFHQRHPDAILVSAWQSLWPGGPQTLAASPYLKSLPAERNGRLDFVGWVMDHGIPKDAFVDLGVLPNESFGPIFRSVDAALFPNRGEGGTNLVAMECLASGVPCVIADNTGQKDLVAACNTYALTHQASVDPKLTDWGVEGWGESDVDEIIARLEEIYTRREEAEARGSVSAWVMKQWNWPDKADAIIANILAN